MVTRLREFFKAAPLSHIGSEEVFAYREWRLSGKSQTRFKRHVGPAIVNMEIGCLRRILKRAKRWQLIADDVKPLKEPTFEGRALSHEEKLHLLKIAKQKPEWETALYAANLAIRTTMRGCELRGLRWADVNLIDGELTVRRSKTEAGERKIPLVQEALETLMKLRKRAEMFGSVESSHYVFAAFRLKCRFKNKPGERGGTVAGTDMDGFDPTRHLGSWRTAWRTLTEEAGLKGLRFHDLRHTAITTLAESGESEQTIMAIAGHVSRRMLERYSHIRMAAKRKVIAALSDRPTQVSAQPTPAKGGIPSGTSQSASQNCVPEGSDGLAPPQVFESNGRPVGTRTPDLYRVKVAL